MKNRPLFPRFVAVLITFSLAGSSSASAAVNVRVAPAAQAGVAGTVGAAGVAAIAPASVNMSIQLGGITPSLSNPGVQAALPFAKTQVAGIAAPSVLPTVIPVENVAAAPAGGSLVPAVSGSPVKTQGAQTRAASPAASAAPMASAPKRSGLNLPTAVSEDAGRAPGKTRKSLLPKIEFSGLSPSRLANMTAAGAASAGRWLMDKVLGRDSVRGTGAVQAGARAPAASAKKGKKASAALKSGKQSEEELKKYVYPFSPWRLSTFQYDPEKYAMTFIFGQRDNSPRIYEFLVGIAAHEALEVIFKAIKAGRPGKDITLKEILAEYDKAWKREKAKNRYAARDGWKAAEYKRRGEDYIRTRYEQMYPFEELGRIVDLEPTVLWQMTDPATGKTYDFKGKIDRLMIKGDTVEIRDWKTHFSPPSLRQLEEDVQLALYAIALKKTRPDLMEGKKIKLAWDFKDFSQEIMADDAYLARVEEKVFGILRRIDTFVERVEAERAEWEKRIAPDKRPRGFAKAKRTVDELGAVQTELSERKAALSKARSEYRELEEGITRYADKRGVALVKGRRHTASVEHKETKGAVPTKTDDPEGYAAVAEVLKEGGVWESYSKLDPAAVRRMAEERGGSDHQAFLKIQADLRSEHANDLQVDEKDDPEPGKGGVKRPTLPKMPWAPNAESGLLSATQIATFLQSREDFVKRYIFRMRDTGPKPMGFLAGSAIHETMERLYIWLKGGRLLKDVTLKDLLDEFDDRWAALRDEADYRPDKGLTAADYKRGSKTYIRAMWKKHHPFDQGTPVFMEKRVHFTLTDPETGKTYKFQGIPDRVMLNADVIEIRDWKSHMNPPTDEEVRQKDYQLGIYILALRQLFPDLMRGRHARLIWDFRNKSTVIEADEAYIKDLEKRLFKVLREMDALKDEVEADRQAWEDKLRPVTVPRNKTQAAKAVDRMGELAAEIDRTQDEIKDLKARAAALEGEVIDFSRRTGRVRIEGKTHVSHLRKSGKVSVPTKSREREAFDRIVAELKAAGVWEKYSAMDTRALKKAADDPKHPDREVLDRIKPYLRDLSSTKVKVSPTTGSRSAG